MSSINTNGINANYPIPGVNNNSQGFRDNFTSIKINLDTASSEITDLQQKVIVKSALDGIPLDNDMANTLISNAAIQGFRSTTKLLGNNLAGTVLVDLTLGDVQYGSLTGNAILQFAKWAPANTQSNVQVIFGVTPGQTITLPVQVTDGATSLEGYSGTGIGGVITIPTGVSRVHYNFTTIDCGTNIEIQPLDRPRTPTAVSAGTFIANGTARVDAISSNNSVIVTGNVHPSSNLQYNLGTPTNRWNDLYMSGNTIFIGDQTITITGEYTRLGNLLTGNAQLGNVALANYFVGDIGEFDTVVAKINANLGPVGNIKIFGGMNGQALTTDGLGNLTWTSVAPLSAPIPAIYFTADTAGNNQSFSNSYLSSYSSKDEITLFLNGALLTNDFYTLTGNSLTISTPLAVGDSIDVVREQGSNASLAGVMSSTPQTKAANAPGTPGQISWDEQFFYVCTGINTWKRTQLTGGY